MQAIHKFLPDRRDMIIIMTALSAAVLYRVFPRETVIQDVIVLTAFFVALPVFTLHFGARLPLSTYGIRRRGGMRGVILALLSSAALSLVFFVAITMNRELEQVIRIPGIAQEGLSMIMYSALLMYSAIVHAFFYGGVIGCGLWRQGIMTVLAVTLCSVLVTSGEIGVGVIGGTVAMVMAALIGYFARALSSPMLFFFLTSGVILMVRIYAV